MKPTFIALLALCLPLAGADKKKPGTVLWEFQTEGLVHPSPAIGSDGTVYVGSGFKLYAIKTDSKGLAKSPWPMRGQNAQHTGRAAGAAAAPVAKPEPAKPEPAKPEPAKKF